MQIGKLVAKILGLTLFAGMVGIVGPSAAAQQAPPATPGPSEEKTSGDWVGASVVHPERWFVERERNTYDETFGFVLWKPEPGAVSDHGGIPTLRIARAPEIKPGQINKTVEEKISTYPNLPLQREKVFVSEKNLQGIAVGPIPGAIPSTEVYVPVNGRVYQINVYGEELGAKGRELLSDVRFYQPSRSVESLGFEEAAEDPDKSLIQQPESTANFKEQTFSAQSVRRERKLSGGCWRADRRFFIQTQHDRYANRKKGDGIRRGWTVNGRPNYWGQYTHGNLGYGRCNKSSYTNDKFAVDYPFNRGDRIYSPFKRGKVMFAGRNYTHRHYGKMVVIKANNGKYVSLSAHLSHIPDRIKPGRTVYKNTVIGRAGNSGDPSIPVGEVHLHQAFYRYPSYNPDGSPYGGASLKVDRLRYSGAAAKLKRFTVKSGRYRLAKIKPNHRRFCEERIRCGEGYKLGN